MELFPTPSNKKRPASMDANYNSLEVEWPASMESITQSLPHYLRTQFGIFFPKYMLIVLYLREQTFLLSRSNVQGRDDISGYWVYYFVFWPFNSVCTLPDLRLPSDVDSASRSGSIYLFKNKDS